VLSVRHCKVNGQRTDNANLFMLFSVLLAAYRWLVCWLLQATANKIKSQHQLGKDAFSAKNNTQTFFAKTLSLAFIEVSCSTVQFQTHFLTHCGWVTQICVFNAVELGTFASFP